jgi:hypothetical protein
MPQQDAGQGAGVWCAEPGYRAAGPIAACRAMACRARRIGRSLPIGKTVLGVPACTRVCGSAALDPGGT